MDHQIQDILAFSKIGRKNENRTEIDIGRLFEVAVADHTMAIAEAGATVSIGDDLPVVVGIESELARVCGNLISNAVKYRSAERRLDIRIEGRIERDQAVFSVTDNGIGIDPQFHDRIFRMFQRLHADELDFEGTGIGLAICRKVIEHHGGRLWLDSAAGQGCKFVFTLPTDRPKP